MKRLFFLSLALIIIFSSCINYSERALDRAAELSEQEKLEIYEEVIEKGKADERIFYNAALLYTYFCRYDDALVIILENTDSYRFMTLYLYIAESLDDESMEKDALIKLSRLVPSDISILSRLMKLYEKEGDPDNELSIALSILYFEKDNQDALKVLAKRYDGFSIFVEEMTLDEYLNEGCPFYYAALSPLLEKEERQIPFSSGIQDPE